MNGDLIVISKRKIINRRIKCKQTSLSISLSFVSGYQSPVSPQGYPFLLKPSANTHTLVQALQSRTKLCRAELYCAAVVTHLSQLNSAGKRCVMLREMCKKIKINNNLSTYDLGWPYSV